MNFVRIPCPFACHTIHICGACILHQSLHWAIIVSARICLTIREFRQPQHALIEALEADAPGPVVTDRESAFTVITGKGGSPRLVVRRAVRIDRNPTLSQEEQR